MPLQGHNLTTLQDIARATLEGHQRAIMGAMTVDEIFKDRKKFSEQVFDVASTDLVNMGIQVNSLFDHINYFPHFRLVLSLDW